MPRLITANSRSPRTIFGRWAILSLVLTSVPLLVAAGLLTASGWRDSSREVEKELAREARATAHAFGEAIHREHETLRALSLSPVLNARLAERNARYEAAAFPRVARLREEAERWRGGRGADLTLDEEATRRLMRAHEAFPELSSLALSDIEGALVAAAGPSPDYRLAEEPWWREALERGVALSVESTPGDEEQESLTHAVLTMAVAIEAMEDARPIGVLAARLDLDAVADDVLWSGSRITRLALADAERRLLERMSAPLGKDELDAPLLSATTKIGTKDLSQPLARDADSKALATALDKLGWQIEVSAPRSRFASGEGGGPRALVFVLLAVAVLASVGSVALTQRFSSRIRALTRASESAAAGVERPELPASGSDELSPLVEGLETAFTRHHDALAHLRESVVRANERAGRLEDTNRQLESERRDLRVVERRLRLFEEMTTHMLGCRERKDVHEVVAAYGELLFRNATGALYLIDEQTETVETFTAWGPDAERESRRSFSLDNCKSLRDGVVRRVEKAPRALSCRHLDDSDFEQGLCLPVIAHGRTLGILHLRTSRPAGSKLSLPLPDLMEERTLREADALAKHAGLAIANVTLREELQRQAVRDALTGLYNRRYLEEALERELARARRSGQPVSVAVLDIDHFKSINDRHGHGGGDAVLREIGELLTNSVRRGDLACRYGGEEFTLVLPGVGREDAIRRIADILESVRRLSVPYQRWTINPITLSAGIATFPDHGGTSDEVLVAADMALYAAKEGGRDAWVCASPRSTLHNFMPESDPAAERRGKQQPLADARLVGARSSRPPSTF